MYTKKERKQHQSDLVAALRSGKYKQGRHFLRTQDGFCCLGVACDISGLGEWTFIEEEFPYDYIGSDSLLPEEVREYFGFNDRSGGFTNKEGNFNSLICLNDSTYTFEEIADVIEKRPEEMFFI